MNKIKTKYIVRIAVISAIYTALSVLLSPLSYGPLQIRVSEALTILPVIMPEAVLGVIIGCFLTNLIGVFTGANILGALDIFFGTLATALAAIATYKLRNFRLLKLPFASALPPIIFNAVIIGAQLTYLFTGGFNLIVFLTQAAWISIGQSVSCLILGIFLLYTIEKTPPLLNALTK